MGSRTGPMRSSLSERTVALVRLVPVTLSAAVLSTRQTEPPEHFVNAPRHEARGLRRFLDVMVMPVEKVRGVGGFEAIPRSLPSVLEQSLQADARIRVEVERRSMNLESRRGMDRDGSFGRRSKLADISAPGVGQQQRHRTRRDALEFHPDCSQFLPGKMFREQENVVDAVADLAMILLELLAIPAEPIRPLQRLVRALNDKIDVI
jgi:hypothetical protein